MPDPFPPLHAALAECMLADQSRLRRRLQGLARRRREGKPHERGLRELEQALEASRARRQRRAAQRPSIDYPPQLPVSEKRAEIAAAIEAHQVVVIAGETGSGKTTQIPKICLELGRGVAGLIGHTQPRRIAARSVAGRIAEELHTPLGQAVGYKVRFQDRIGEHSYIKLMTDGILLAEIQGARRLEQYDTLIIDEAHERSLNIDFLLGYLRQLLPKRPDLKLIITSATINTERFAEFFAEAPVIEVSGRTYPVEVRYRPLVDESEEGRDRDLPEAIIEAVDECGGEDPLGDILIFLPGEREIRSTAELLRKHRLAETEVVPLYSRLAARDQDRVFRAHRGRRIVLATNVAETSLTVPGIRFVIDSGLARLSRYSHRTKVQRLPIEPVSQASANQRAGRCGRVSAGICIRLYSEADYLGRPQFTDPELLRTNLASVILQMSALGLGEVERFPFIDPPDRRYIKDGFRLLFELGAVDARHRLSEIGRRLARLPLDPRLGRMLLAAEREGALHEVLIIAAALAIQDPRERPHDAQQAADTAHARFRHERSDFLAYLALWQHYHEQARHLSQNKLRKYCRENFLSYVRLREWHDLHGQLLAVVRELGLRPNEQAADYGAIHRALLSGLLGQVAFKDEGGEYLGARNIKLAIFPGSGLRKKRPKWIVAAELLETGRLYAHTVAAIEPAWLESLAGHLIKRNYFEPHWEKRAAQVAAFEQLTLYGLNVVARRRVNYGPIDPVLARELFIRHALVQGEYRSRAQCLAHNRRLLDELESLEAKARRRDILADEQSLYEFYAARLPEGIYSGKQFESWYRKARADAPRLLYLSEADLVRQPEAAVEAERFPDHLQLGGVRLPLAYQFEPGHPADGVTVLIPLGLLGRLEASAFERLVPGLLQEKLIALIKSLPKSLRRNFVPANDFAAACLAGVRRSALPLNAALADELKRMTRVEVPPAAWDPDKLPPHLQMNFRLLDERGKPLAEGRDLAALQRQWAGEVRAQLAAGHAEAETSGGGLERSGITAWDFDQLPEQVEVERHGVSLRAYPALVDEGESIALRLFESPALAAEKTHAGLRRLFMLQAADKLRYLRKQLPGRQQLCLHYVGVGSCEALTEDILQAAAERAFLHQQPPVHDAEAFARRLEAGRIRLGAEAAALAELLGPLLADYHRLAKGLKGSIAPQRLAAIQDIRAQLEGLVHPGFVSATPPQWLPHLGRYLQALQRRLEKLDRDPQGDRLRVQQITPLWQACTAQLQRWAESGRQAPEELVEFRWLLEELRVSLFAQELKTIQPVSVKRLERRWRELEQSLATA